MNTKQNIYEVAKILYVQEGYHKITNKKIEEFSGINQGLITYYFKSKSNIASTIIKESYQIISAYLRNEIDVNKDPFLFNITIDNLMCRLAQYSENFQRFLCELIEDDIILDTVYGGSQKNDIVIMIKKLVPESSENITKHFRKFVIMTFPVAMKFQVEISKSDNFTFDEYYDTMVRLFAFALNQKIDDETIEAYIKTSSAIAEKVILEHPFLKSPEEYLFNQELLKDCSR